jgi:hypothetical protein
MFSAFVLALSSPPVGFQSASPCDLAISEYRGANTFELGMGFKICEEEGRADDAAILALLASIRASADLILLPPKDILALMEREGSNALFAVSGKYVDEELARDPARFAALLEKVRASDLSIDANYDPGWAIDDSNKRALYADVIEGLRTDRLALANYVATLVRDDVYFQAYRERRALLANLSENGSQLPDRFGQLAKIMQERKALLGDPPTQTAVTWREVYEPGPEAPFSVLHRGYNGPKESDLALFRSSLELTESWVGTALSQEQLTGVLAQIDFDKEVLGVMAIGEMSNATANFFVTEFGPGEYYAHSIAVRVGVAGDTAQCGFEPSRSYPFILVKASSQVDGGLTSMSRANYPDQCAPVVEGVPTSLAESD